MDTIIRQATVDDALRWLDLLKRVLGDDYPDLQVYDTAWIGSQLDPAVGHETWVVERNGGLAASVSFLQPMSQTRNPVVNLGRQLFPAESIEDGSAEALLNQVNQLGQERKQAIIARVLAGDAGQQQLFEKLGYICAGFQPFKHVIRNRHGALFYLRLATQESGQRHPVSESLHQIIDLANAVLERVQMPALTIVRDGVTGYPLQADLQIETASYHDFALWRLHAQSSAPATELSSGYNLGLGYLRTSGDAPVRAVLAKRSGKVLAGLAFLEDTLDRCVRLVDSFGAEDTATGMLFQHVAKQSQEQFNAAYVEADVLVSAPRLLKTAEQLGFAPVAYLPALFANAEGRTDVVKMVRLNMAYAPEPAEFCAGARPIVTLIDQHFQDQKIGVAIMNLLRGLSIFSGLGEGELRKVARLLVQRLYRPGETVFHKGDAGDQAYVVMRGQIEIHLEDKTLPIAMVTSGQIFGELAFLDGSPRIATAIANQATIVLVIARDAFNDLMQREPRLGLVVLRNMALELSNRLRRTNIVASAVKK
ncbi:MAG TPA: cyclic nucleotide-binding domain-containing protein [Candidatus Nitrosotalea sp.]|nr:cyclic nucleotide-binding domain-containing protein [Candidatus Nitrosotalea sp.]